MPVFLGVLSLPLLPSHSALFSQCVWLLSLPYTGTPTATPHLPPRAPDPCFQTLPCHFHHIQLMGYSFKIKLSICCLKFFLKQNRTLSHTHNTDKCISLPCHHPAQICPFFDTPCQLKSSMVITFCLFYVQNLVSFTSSFYPLGHCLVAYLYPLLKTLQS